jgi:hypothetical protein
VKEEKFTFTYTFGDRNVVMTLGMGLNLDEMCEQFENFLLASGYRLDAGEHVGLVDDDFPGERKEKEKEKAEDPAPLYHSSPNTYLKFDGNHTDWATDDTVIFPGHL